jgi:hypothetical protein
MSFDPADIKPADLHDAKFELRNAPYPSSLPSDAALDALEVGQCVKVGVGEHGNGSEAFWVELVAISPLQIQMLGVIVNQLKHTAKHNLAAGDFIVVQRDNVFAITD